jgi:hypothetical protein
MLDRFAPAALSLPRKLAGLIRFLDLAMAGTGRWGLEARQR